MRRLRHTDPGIAPPSSHAAALQLVDENEGARTRASGGDPGIAEPAALESLEDSDVTAQPMTYQAIRVAVRATAEGAFIALPLAPGESAPPGTREALFVALDPNTRLV